MTCPICKSKTALDKTADVASYRPFCSKRCKLVDLGKWFGGEYSIAGPPVLDPGDVGAYGEQDQGFDLNFSGDYDLGDVDDDTPNSPETDLPS